MLDQIHSIEDLYKCKVSNRVPCAYSLQVFTLSSLVLRPHH